MRRLAASRKQEARVVQRAKVIVAMAEDRALTARDAALQAGFASVQSGITWVKRFNADGVAGLCDVPRSGARVTYNEEVRGRLIALARQKPRSLGYVFELWRLQRLQDAFAEREEVRVARSTLWEWLSAEGLIWKRQQSWLHDVQKQAPELVEKRGPSSRPI